MKNKLISLLQELIAENDEKDFVGIRFGIMENTAFLRHPKNFSEISTVITVVNAYIESPNEISKANVKKVITNLNAKF